MAQKNTHDILIYILKHDKIHTRIFIIFKKIKKERRKQKPGSVTCGMGFGDKNGDIAVDNRFYKILLLVSQYKHFTYSKIKLRRTQIT